MFELNRCRNYRQYFELKSKKKNKIKLFAGRGVGGIIATDIDAHNLVVLFFFPSIFSANMSRILRFLTKHLTQGDNKEIKFDYRSGRRNLQCGLRIPDVLLEILKTTVSLNLVYTHKISILFKWFTLSVSNLFLTFYCSISSECKCFWFDFMYFFQISN